MKKVHFKSQKNCIFRLKGDCEPQYFNIRTIKNPVNFSIKNVLKISPKLGLSVLINFVLVGGKECTVLKNFCLTSVNFGQNGLNIVLTIHTLQFLYQKSIIFKLTLYCNNDII